MKKFVLGVGAVSVVGLGFCGVVYQRRLKENRSTTAVAWNAKQDQARVKAALDSLTTATPAKVILYRYTTCPFCSKVKALLDWQKIPHECIEVEPMLKGEIAASEYKKVPQLQFFDKQGPYLVDSDIIVDRVAEAKNMQSQLTDPDVKKWRDWAKDSLVRHLVVNINQSLVSAWGGYSYIDDIDTIPYRNKLFLKVMGAPVMYLVSRYKTMPALVAANEIKATDDVRSVLHQQIDKFSTMLAEPTKGTKTPKAFHGGQSPDLADVDVYGVLQSIRGHSIYDDMLKNTSIKPWVDRMDIATGKAPYLLKQ